ncbi:MAG TPA: class I SAM-dependent methyltransferase [Candidatus Acidoferrales bacterium]|nr:class I SAM-dependent methyltransferase [Candidatus Acidoferrales bacterium]
MEITPATYERWRETTLGPITERLEREAVFSLVPAIAGLAVLDAGCGDGTYAIEASRRGAVVAGLDSSAPMLAAAREREQEILSRAAILWCRGKVEALPFGDACFDLVFLITVLCWVRARSQAMREVARVLRPGGILLLGELGRLSSWALVRTVRGWLGSRLWKEAHFWTAGELRTLLQDAGLEPGAARGAVYYPPLASCAALASRCDRSLSVLGGWGAAFLAIRAVKPGQAKSTSPVA